MEDVRRGLYRAWLRWRKVVLTYYCYLRSPHLLDPAHKNNQDISFVLISKDRGKIIHYLVSYAFCAICAVKKVKGFRLGFITQQRGFLFRHGDEWFIQKKRKGKDGDEVAVVEKLSCTEKKYACESGVCAKTSSSAWVQSTWTMGYGLLSHLEQQLSNLLVYSLRCRFSWTNDGAECLVKFGIIDWWSNCSESHRVRRESIVAILH